MDNDQHISEKDLEKKVNGIIRQGYGRATRKKRILNSSRSAAESLVALNAFLYFHLNCLFYSALWFFSYYDQEILSAAHGEVAEWSKAAVC